ncbi:hypothetical protein ACFLT1_03660 [Bacteroidota bacterium]
MKNQFVCPHCRGHLLVREKVVFKVRNAKKKNGLLLLSPEIGNYTSHTHPEFEYSEGDPLDFYCPLCSHILSTTIDKNLIYVLMIDDQQVEHDIYFSRIIGEHSTYLVTGDTVEAAGEHSGKYTYFNISDRFRKFLKK